MPVTLSIEEQQMVRQAAERLRSRFEGQLNTETIERFVTDSVEELGARATTTTWSPVLKKLIALATLTMPHFAEGTRVECEITVEAVRHRVPAVVVKTPFFNPRRKIDPIA